MADTFSVRCAGSAKTAAWPLAKWDLIPGNVYLARPATEEEALNYPLGDFWYIDEAGDECWGSWGKDPEVVWERVDTE